LPSYRTFTSDQHSLAKSLAFLSSTSDLIWIAPHSNSSATHRAALMRWVGSWNHRAIRHRSSRVTGRVRCVSSSSMRRVAHIKQPTCWCSQGFSAALPCSIAYTCFRTPMYLTMVLYLSAVPCPHLPRPGMLNHAMYLHTLSAENRSQSVPDASQKVRQLLSTDWYPFVIGAAQTLHQSSDSCWSSSADKPRTRGEATPRWPPLGPIVREC
jgi:hypothetical protein